MKKYILNITAILLTISLVAQKNFTIDNQRTFIDGMSTDAIHVSMKADKDEAKKALNNYIQDVHNIDIKGYGFFQKKDELTTDPISITFLSDEKLILNTHFMGDDLYTEMNVFVLKSDGSRLDMEKDVNIISNLESLSEEYVAYFLPDYYEEQVSKSQEAYDDLISTIDGIGNDMSDKRKEIESLEEEIAHLRLERKEKTALLEMQEEELEKMSEIFQKVKDRTSSF